MIKSAYVIGAAFIAAGIVALPSLSPQVQAHVPVPGAKADRVDARPLGSACSRREWPYFDSGCMRDARNRFAEAPPVRMVWTDRLPPLPEDPTRP